MLETKAISDVGTYTDLQALKSLHHQMNTNPDMAKKEVAAQFESLLVQMLMKSMRDANQALASDGDSDQQSALYQDLFDKQLSLVVSHSNTGIAHTIEASIPNPPSVDPVSSPDLLPSMVSMPKAASAMDSTITEVPLPAVKEAPSAFDSPESFVKGLWSYAKEAAAVIGGDPKLLLAQAALETNWGKCVLPMMSGESTHNLFNIKEGHHWDAPVTEANAVEFEDGLMVKSKSKFRAYDSYADSFKDYVQFLKTNTRYQEALKHAAQPHEFATQLQKASYATDEHYSEKIMQIYHSKRFNELLAHAKLI